MKFPILAITISILSAGCAAPNPATTTLSGTVAPATTTAQSEPEWKVDSSVGIDGTKTVIAQVMGESLGIVLRKHGAHLELYATSPASYAMFFGLEQRRPVRWKIDNGKLHAEFWACSDDGEALFSPAPYTLTHALTNIGKGHVLFIEVPPYGQTPETIKIDLPAELPTEFQKMTAP